MKYYSGRQKKIRMDLKHTKLKKYWKRYISDLKRPKFVLLDPQHNGWPLALSRWCLVGILSVKIHSYLFGHDPFAHIWLWFVHTLSVTTYSYYFAYNLLTLFWSQPVCICWSQFFRNLSVTTICILLIMINLHLFGHDTFTPFRSRSIHTFCSRPFPAFRSRPICTFFGHNTFTPFKSRHVRIYWIM